MRRRTKTSNKKSTVSDDIYVKLRPRRVIGKPQRASTPLNEGRGIRGLSLFRDMGTVKGPRIGGRIPSVTSKCRRRRKGVLKNRKPPDFVLKRRRDTPLRSARALELSSPGVLKELRFSRSSDLAKKWRSGGSSSECSLESAEFASRAEKSDPQTIRDAEESLTKDEERGSVTSSVGDTSFIGGDLNSPEFPKSRESSFRIGEGVGVPKKLRFSRSSDRNKKWVSGGNTSTSYDLSVGSPIVTPVENPDRQRRRNGEEPLVGDEAGGSKDSRIDETSFAAAFDTTVRPENRKASSRSGETLEPPRNEGDFPEHNASTSIEMCRRDSCSDAISPTVCYSYDLDLLIDDVDVPSRGSSSSSARANRGDSEEILEVAKRGDCSHDTEDRSLASREKISDLSNCLRQSEKRATSNSTSIDERHSEGIVVWEEEENASSHQKKSRMLHASSQAENVDKCCSKKQKCRKDDFWKAEVKQLKEEDRIDVLIATAEEDSKHMKALPNSETVMEQRNIQSSKHEIPRKRKEKLDHKVNLKGARAKARRIVDARTKNPERINPHTTISVPKNSFGNHRETFDFQSLESTSTFKMPRDSFLKTFDGQDLLAKESEPFKGYGKSVKERLKPKIGHKSEFVLKNDLPIAETELSGLRVKSVKEHCKSAIINKQKSVLGNDESVTETLLPRVHGKSVREHFTLEVSNRRQSALRDELPQAEPCKIPEESVKGRYKSEVTKKQEYDPRKGSEHKKRKTAQGSEGLKSGEDPVFFQSSCILPDCRVAHEKPLGVNGKSVKEGTKTDVHSKRQLVLRNGQEHKKRKTPQESEDLKSGLFTPRRGCKLVKGKPLGDWKNSVRECSESEIIHKRESVRRNGRGRTELGMGMDAKTAAESRDLKCDRESTLSQNRGHETTKGKSPKFFKKLVEERPDSKLCCKREYVGERKKTGFRKNISAMSKSSESRSQNGSVYLYRNRPIFFQDLPIDDLVKEKYSKRKAKSRGSTQDEEPELVSWRETKKLL